ncbi:MAG: hypothetical protein WCS43_11550, partial [Verrucomicrobiota bacterium]
MKTQSLTLLAALLLFGVGGFVAGRKSAPESSDSANQDRLNDTESSRPFASSTNGDSATGPGGKKSTHSERSARAAGTPAERIARLQTIMRGENPLDRNRALLAFIDQLAPGDFEDAVAQFRKMGITDQRFGEYALLLSAWAKVDPLAALTFAKANTRNGFATSTILTTWASNDPEAAIRWAEASHQGDGANPYLASIIRSLAGTDPVRATQLLTGMPKSQERGEALDAMMPHLLTQDGNAVRAWIAALPDDSLKDGAMMRSATTLAASDPAGTASWLAANPSQATQRTMDDVYSVWAEKDLQGAINSISAVATPENRSNALRGVVNNLANTDPRAAVALMNRFPNDVSDRMVQQLVWHSFGSDPSLAINQINRIADEGQRNDMYG